MCEICIAICKNIEETFGHNVNPIELANLIEKSPVSEILTKHKLHIIPEYEKTKDYIYYLKVIIKLPIRLIKFILKTIEQTVDELY